MNFVVHSLLLGSHQNGFDQHDHHTRDEASEEGVGPTPVGPVCCPADAGAQLDKLQRMGEEIEEREEREHNHQHDHSHSLAACHTRTTGGDDDDSDGLDEMENDIDELSSSEAHQKLSEEERKRLSRMSLNTAIAIGLHNFPEGLATFIAALGDPKVGAVLAIAIAIHNIPEGKTLEGLLMFEDQNAVLTKRNKFRLVIVTCQDFA
jgi:zinc transporter ZupT